MLLSMKMIKHWYRLPSLRILFFNQKKFLIKKVLVGFNFLNKEYIHKIKIFSTMKRKVSQVSSFSHIPDHHFPPHHILPSLLPILCHRQPMLLAFYVSIDDTWVDRQIYTFIHVYILFLSFFTQLVASYTHFYQRVYLRGLST